MKFKISYGQQTYYLNHVHIVHINEEGIPYIYLKTVTGDEYYVELYGPFDDSKKYIHECFNLRIIEEIKNKIEMYLSDLLEEQYIEIDATKLRIFNTEFKRIGDGLQSIEESLKKLNITLEENNYAC